MIELLKENVNMTKERIINLLEKWHNFDTKTINLSEWLTSKGLIIDSLATLEDNSVDTFQV